MDALLIRERDSMTAKFFLQSRYYHQASSFPPENSADRENSYDGPSPYHVNYCGFENCQPGYAFGPRSRTSYLIHIILAGKGKYYVNDKVYEISAGQMFLIYPNVTVTYQADVDDPWSYGWIGFSGHNSEMILSQIGFSRDQLVVTVDDIEPMRQRIENIMGTHKLTYANELYRTAEMLCFFAYAIEHSALKKDRSPEYSRSVYAQMAMKYMENNFMNRIKISELADYIGIDRSYLSKSFREEYHISPQEYLIRLRMEKAEYMLVNSVESIAEIALNVGYPDALAFSKLFKQRYGISPTEYRSERSNTKEDNL